ncbi:MAG: Mut7-C ubiquitin/RNAse domain-containing protein [Bacteroidales bacterium]|nr:Mut7-C ubiquitin/RNAse domain-containing protein [Bacteroidales bacterium]
MPTTVYLRFYEELNDFLLGHKRKLSFEHTFNGNMSIKDVIESIGVPHTEVDMILANGKSVDFKFKAKDQDQISVYPIFESIDISEITRLRPKPLRNTKFILDVHLGKLARYLRMIGFDTLYENNYTDPFIIETSISERRIILTRDLGILKNKQVTHGYYIRSTNSKEQLKEIIDRFDLGKNIQPLNRCIECNGSIKIVRKKEIEYLLKPKTRKYFNEFFQCTNCKKVYWEGSHYHNIMEQINNL